MDEKRIVEIDGVKVEADLRTAKRVDTYKVGDNIEKFEREIQKKKNEYTDLQNQLEYFKKHFLKECAE